MTESSGAKCAINQATDAKDQSAPDQLAPDTAPANVPNLPAAGPLAAYGWFGPASIGTGTTTITVAIATPDTLLTTDQGPAISQAMPQEWLPLLHAAELEWEIVANIHFVDITKEALGLGGAPNMIATPDILIGVAPLTTDEKTADFAGFTYWQRDADGYFLPGTVIKLDDPKDGPVVALPDGDFEYVGYPTTVFQTMLHELGHAIGLAHNNDNPASIMNPLLSADNRLPNSQDTEASWLLYGPAPVSAVLNLTQDDIKLLDSLVYNRSELVTG